MVSGVRIVQDNQTLETSVVELFKNSPAVKAGMKEQDIIKGVDGVDVTTMDLDSIVNDHIIGKEGTKVKNKNLQTYDERHADAGDHQAPSGS